MQKLVSYSISEHELVAAYRRQHLRTWKSPRSIGQSALSLVIFWLIAFGVNVMRTGYDGASIAATKFACILLALMLPMYFLGNWFWGDYIKKQFRRRLALQEPYEAFWSDDGLRLRSESTDSYMRWTTLLGWLQDDFGFQIFVEKNSFLLLPQRAFSDEQRDDLHDTLVQSGLPNSGGDEKVIPPIQQEQASRPFIRGRLWSQPFGTALLWFGLMLISVLHAIIFPAGWRGSFSSILFVSAIPVILGMLGSAVLRLRMTSFGLSSALLAIALTAETTAFIWSSFSTPASAFAFGKTLWTMSFAVTALFIWLRYQSHTWMRRGFAIIALIAANIALSSAAQSEGYFWQASSQVRSWLQLKSPHDDAENADPMDGIMADQLWGAQSSLVVDAVKNFRPRMAGMPNVYAMAIAADGTQQIFSREGRAALKFAEERFGKNYRGGLLLSNGSADLLGTPMATLDNFAAAIDQFSGKADPSTDIAFIYLTSHGSKDAQLSTYLPNYSSLTLFSAKAISEILAKAGVRRRIIIVSACYSGSWIPALANDDTIIVTASSKDRTSFGCDDRRNLTLFGENFLQAQPAQGRSLHDVFEAAQTTIAGQEAAWKIAPSKPQAYVGKNMRAVWTQQFANDGVSPNK